MVCTKNSENKFKARLVVTRFKQTETMDDIYFPVIKTQTLKIFLSICLQKMYIINQTDVESAFLNMYLKSEVFVKQPESFDDNSGKVWKLKKALYGLKVHEHGMSVLMNIWKIWVSSVALTTIACI